LALTTRRLKTFGNWRTSPTFDTKEWMRLVAMAMFKRAKMEGADYLAITHPQDGWQ